MSINANPIPDNTKVRWITTFHVRCSFVSLSKSTNDLSNSIPARNHLERQEIFDNWRDIFNNERPHQGIQMKCPVDIYSTSIRKLPFELDEINYDGFDNIVRVSSYGEFRFQNRRIFIGIPLGNQTLGVKQISDELWSVYFMEYELGFFDVSSNNIRRSVNPFLIEGMGSSS